jgi:nitrate reductase cytochrome c-type subunit
VQLASGLIDAHTRVSCHSKTLDPGFLSGPVPLNGTVHSSVDEVVGPEFGGRRFYCLEPQRWDAVSQLQTMPIVVSDFSTRDEV